VLQFSQRNLERPGMQCLQRSFNIRSKTSDAMNLIRFVLQTIYSKSLDQSVIDFEAFIATNTCYRHKQEVSAETVKPTDWLDRYTTFSNVHAPKLPAPHSTRVTRAWQVFANLSRNLQSSRKRLKRNKQIAGTVHYKVDEKSHEVPE